MIAADLPAQSRNGMSLSGATGLFTIPTGRVGWDQSGRSSFGLDLGYHAIMDDGVVSHIPKVALSLLGFLELSAAIDIQPDEHGTSSWFGPRNGHDFIGGLKIQLPVTRSALALGANYRVLNLGEDNHRNYAWQIYVAATYAGHFFNMPAETTIVIGRTFLEGHSNRDIDFGMGFDVMLFPDIFGNLLHWITDFANFSYSVDAFRVNAWHRGVLNTGLRFNLSTIPNFSRFRFMADIKMVDAYDRNRAFSIGATFGVPIM